MYPLLRQLLFALPPEAAHRLAVSAMAAWGSVAPQRRAPVRGINIMGISFSNRIGLAAGLDKDALAPRGFASLGFGFVEVGTVTPRPQFGNPRPRLFRSAADAALINRLGFNSAGVEAMRARLARLRRRGPLAAKLGVNIGKNQATPLASATQDYLTCLRAVHPYADYVTLNLSSPNTVGLRSLQSTRPASTLLGAVVRERDALDAASGRHVPLVAKVSPDLDANGLQEIAAVLRNTRLDGVIATNTSIRRPATLKPSFAAQAGGLSGTPLFPLAMQAVRTLRGALGPEFPIIGVGGIHDGHTAQAMFDAGADLLQIYTSLVFRGPGLLRELRDVAARQPHRRASGGEDELGAHRAGGRAPEPAG